MIILLWLSLGSFFGFCVGLFYARVLNARDQDFWFQRGYDKAVDDYSK